MSHYSVNASVPEVADPVHLRWAIDTAQFGPDESEVLQSVLDTAISPELIPSDARRARPRTARASSARTSCRTSSSSTSLRFGYRPSKVAFLAHHAWDDREQRPLAGPDPRREPQRVLARRDQALARGLPRPLLPHQPVQALRDPERAQGRLRRLAVAARRLARAERLGGDHVAGRAARQRARRVKNARAWVGPAHAHRLLPRVRGVHAPGARRAGAPRRAGRLSRPLDFRPLSPLERRSRAELVRVVGDRRLAETTSLHVATGVTCPTVRIHPAVIAQAAATGGMMHQGRFYLGVGSGEALNEHILGDRWPETDVRLEMLEEAVEVIRTPRSRSRSGGPTRTIRRGSPAPVASSTPRRACRSSRT